MRAVEGGIERFFAFCSTLILSMVVQNSCQYCCIVFYCILLLLDSGTGMNAKAVSVEIRRYAICDTRYFVDKKGSCPRGAF